MVGPTVLMVSIGTGAPARMDSSKKTNCSMAERPWPAVLLGPADAEPAVLAHLAHDPPHAGPMPRRGELLLDLGCQELGVVRPQLLAELLLLLGVCDVHGQPSRLPLYKNTF